jgi:hypothetical protein
MDCPPVIDVRDRKDPARVIVQSQGFFGTGQGRQIALQAIEIAAIEQRYPLIRVFGSRAKLGKNSHQQR